MKKVNTKFAERVLTVFVYRVYFLGERYNTITAEHLAAKNILPAEGKLFLFARGLQGRMIKLEFLEKPEETSTPPTPDVDEEEEKSPTSTVVEEAKST